MPKAPDAFCLTPTAEQIIHVLEGTQRHSDIGVVVGSPGVGKTTAFRHYVEKPISTLNGRRTAFLVQMTQDEEADRPNRMLLRIAEKVGLYVLTPSEACEQLTRRLGQGDLLIIDEAQFLRDSGLEMLRGLHDQGHFGLVLGGNPTVITRGNKVRQARMGHFFSRIGYRCPSLDEPLPEDADALFDHHQVQGARTRMILRRYITPNDGLRQAFEKIVSTAHELAGEGNPIQLTHVEKAIVTRGLPIRI